MMASFLSSKKMTLEKSHTCLSSKQFMKSYEMVLLNIGILNLREDEMVI